LNDTRAASFGPRQGTLRIGKWRAGSPSVGVAQLPGGPLAVDAFDEDALIDFSAAAAAGLGAEFGSAEVAAAEAAWYAASTLPICGSGTTNTTSADNTTTAGAGSATAPLGAPILTTKLVCNVDNGNMTNGNTTGGNTTGGNATGGNTTGGNATGGGGNATGGGGNATGGVNSTTCFAVPTCTLPFNASAWLADRCPEGRPCPIALYDLLAGPIDGLSLSSPRVGDYVLVVSSPPLTPVVIPLTVLPGPAVEIIFEGSDNGTAVATTTSAVIEQTPTLEGVAVVARDVAGNDASSSVAGVALSVATVPGPDAPVLGGLVNHPFAAATGIATISGLIALAPRAGIRHFSLTVVVPDPQAPGGGRVCDICFWGFLFFGFWFFLT
jgi:hypothetical protein